MPAFLARRYVEPVEVVRHDGMPAQFLWRGRLYVVREVLDHWTQTGAWWHSAVVAAMAGGDPSQGPAGIDDDEREHWRIEAQAGRGGASVVVELCFAWSTAAWTITAVGD